MPPISQHIGIVACSAEGAALCYRAICFEGARFMGRHAHPEITMHTFPLSRYMHAIERDDWDGVVELMRASGKILEKAGADFLICPDNTIHQVFDEVVSECTVPWLHIAGEVALEANRRSYKRVGLLGTCYLMEGPVYSEKLLTQAITHAVPQAGDRERINTIIFNELVYGIITPESKEYFAAVIRGLQDDGCDAVVLGCTEIPLLVSDADSPLPTLDSTRILARAALRKAVQAVEQGR